MGEQHVVLQATPGDISARSGPAVARRVSSAAESCCIHLGVLQLQHNLIKQWYSVLVSAAAMRSAAAECMRLL